MSNVWTPRLIKRAAPDAKILVMLRDPIERYRSGIVHRETRAPHRRPETICADAIERGRYATQLERIYRLFDRERVLVLQYERCLLRPEEELARTFAFLRLDPVTVSVGDFARRVNETVIGKVDVPPEVRDALVTAYRPDVERLRRLLPELDVGLWPHFAASA
jgi:hypothetical protein